MLTIHYNNQASQVIRVGSEFYQTQVQGTGNNKKVTTPTDKARALMHDLGGCSFKLMKEDTILSEDGFKPSNNFQSGVVNTNDKEAIKKAKKAFKSYIKDKYSFDFKHGLSVKQIWNKYAIKSTQVSKLVNKQS